MGFPPMIGMNKKNKKTQNKKTIKRTVQQTIPYIEGYENGVMQVEPARFSKTLEIQDISFKTKSEEEQQAIYESYLKLLNALNAGEDIFYTFVNYKVNASEDLDKVLPALTGDVNDKYRKEMRSIMQDKVTTGRKSIKTRKFVTLQTDSPSVDQAMERLNIIETDFEKNYRKLTKTTPQALDLAQRLELLDFILNSDRPNPWFTHQGGKTTVDWSKMKKQKMTTKDLISPEMLKFTDAMIQIDQRYCQVYYLESLANWMNTNFIPDLLSLPFESCIGLHVEPSNQADMASKIKAKTITITAEVEDKQKHDKHVSKELDTMQEQANDLLDDLQNRDQKIFFMNLVIAVFADSKEQLKEFGKYMNSIAAKHSCRLQVLFGQQERALSSFLPLGMDRCFSKRMLTTESLGIFIPFDEVNTMDEGGFYYGTNTINKSLIVYNRLKGQNYNGLITGYSGSGKSFAAKREILNVLLNTNSDVYIIDPDGEYTPLAEAFGGEIIKIAPGNDVHINPFDLDIDTSKDTDGDPIAMKTDFICGMIETMMGANACLSPIQRSIMDRCITQIYKPYLEHLVELPPLPNGKKRTIDRTYCPTMQNLFSALLAQPQAEAQNLALVMETYTTGTFDAFAHQTNVDRNNRLVVYDIKNIGTNLRELALKVCLNDIWTKMVDNSRENKWTWFYVDEFHLLLTNNSTAEFLKTVWKRARKWQGVPTGITQNIEDVLSSSQARAIINNTSFLYLLNQAKIDRDMLAEILGLSENDVEFITNADTGCGLIYTGKQVIPFTDAFPTNTECYRIMSTKPKDLEEV